MSGPARWGLVYGTVVVVGLVLGVLLAFLRGANGPLGGASTTAVLVIATPPPASTPAPAPNPPAAQAPSVSPAASALPARSVLPSVVPSPSPGRTFMVRPGDTLQRIALEVYGDADQWTRLYDANRAAIGPDPNNLQAGMVLRVP